MVLINNVMTNVHQEGRDSYEHLSGCSTKSTHEVLDHVARNFGTSTRVT
jgi:hypothetical protein